jgi:E3 ubiquitin-protein ligase HECTD1
VTARALTYFLDVSADCAKKITAHSSVIGAMCTSLQDVDVDDRTNRDLAEQIIKVFERLCLREASSIYEQDGLRSVLNFINHCYASIHKDSLQSALNVVVKLIGKLDPQNAPTLDQTIESLSNLLLHEDTFVSDNALRCFATLADRFARKDVDPESLMRYCLKDVLIRSLQHVSKSTGISSTSNETNHGQMIRGVTTNISVVTGLLSALCRASAKVTNDLLKSDLLDALESALCAGDERCVLDTMRFVDLLIGLIFEGKTKASTYVQVYRSHSGRSKLARPLRSTIGNNTIASNVTTAESSSSTGNTPSDQYQQKIIEHIRSRDCQAFIQFIEDNQIDVNYIDHVGQTVLNWVSAFGTREMVEYLCRKGADVNRGQRSSSLHYAASFGRPSIVRVLLKYGANIDLRDEDGRTPLDKARERHDGNHREILDILQSAHEWTETKGSSNESLLSIECSEEDKQMQSTYFQRLLAIFCRLYQNSMIVTIKRSTLRLISKLFQYATVEQIHQIPSITILFELLATILDTNEDDDDDTINFVLSIVQHLLEKDRHAFLDQFQYLGLISKITALALAHQHADKTGEQLQITTRIHPTDANQILPYQLYLWNEYHILRNRECVYIWTNLLVIELSMGSNGWFRYFANNVLSTMYSSGRSILNIRLDCDGYL